MTNSTPPINPEMFTDVSGFISRSKTNPGTYDAFDMSGDLIGNFPDFREAAAMFEEADGPRNFAPVDSDQFVDPNLLHRESADACCNFCYFSGEAAAGPLLRCRRYPPTKSQAWPNVKKDDWCGEFVRDNFK